MVTLLTTLAMAFIEDDYFESVGGTRKQVFYTIVLAEAVVLLINVPIIIYLFSK